MNRSIEERSGTLLLERCSGIQFNGGLINQKDITKGSREEDRKSIVRGATLTAGDDDRAILEEILGTCVPLTITGDSRKPSLVLAAELGRYSFHGEEVDFEVFSVRLVPTRGRVGNVGEREPDLGTISTDRKPGGLVLAAANGRVQLDLYFEQQRSLPPLVPPAAYHPRILL